MNHVKVLSFLRAKLRQSVPFNRVKLMVVGLEVNSWYMLNIYMFNMCWILQCFFFIVCLYLGSWKDNISELHSRDTHPTKHFNCWNFYSTICVTFERILFILSLPDFSARWDCVQCMGFSWSTGLLCHTSMFFDRESSLSCSVQCHTWKRRC